MYSRHTVGTPNILVRASPRHPANASRHAKKFRVPLTVPELVKQKIVGSRASGVGSDFVIDDGTEKHWGWWLVSRSAANHLRGRLKDLRMDMFLAMKLNSQ
ncbi:TPA: hypothetical protein KCG78_004761 [Escherichia coli]|uniref:hypothetical protein n=1 Tax=Escherichia coli TaxID=562 RepID=UPI001CBB690A|nr:hypothetical protein [Escherichia coli]MBZ1417439.1 hypothetical protein [Escherichia coli]HBB7333840.1 hypothetical protein [Escherichia coli]HDS4616428.1 hypothetical protein [Escherichia coli]